MNNEPTLCRLCDKPNKLIKAHIIPDWAHRKLKQDNHLIVLNADAKSRKIQSGFWDDSILCGECDNEIIGVYDAYAKQFLDKDWTDSIQRKEAPRNGYVEYIVVKDFDYPKLQLFFISVLWRASISKLDQFKQISLGKYEEIAKEMISSGKPSHEEIFQIVLSYFRPQNDGLDFEKAILSPKRAWLAGAFSYNFTLAGFEAFVKVSKSHSTLHVNELTLRPEGFHILVRNYEKSALYKYFQHIKQKLI